MRRERFAELLRAIRRERFAELLRAIRRERFAELLRAIRRERFAELLRAIRRERFAELLRAIRRERFAEFFSLQFLRNFSNLGAAHYGSQHNNRFRVCYAELTLTTSINYKQLTVSFTA
ncbi:magnesium transporter MgtE N-terminal domain-containing protein [Leptospira kirschneri]|uniref:magnesium transporter MgtE N-terminal domain-containing protein n=1 Tax=Leptospira kirschneri TaxID=29507 RepID=UPI001E429AED|nr:hypothetical protein [Leptospira kirschneri]